MKTICSLRFKEAIAAIQGTKTVMYKHGVWNEFMMSFMPMQICSSKRDRGGNNYV